MKILGKGSYCWVVELGNQELIGITGMNSDPKPGQEIDLIKTIEHVRQLAYKEGTLKSQADSLRAIATLLDETAQAVNPLFKEAKG